MPRRTAIPAALALTGPAVPATLSPIIIMECDAWIASGPELVHGTPTHWHRVVEIVEHYRWVGPPNPLPFDLETLDDTDLLALTLLPDDTRTQPHLLPGAFDALRPAHADRAVGTSRPGPGSPPPWRGWAAFSDTVTHMHTRDCTCGCCDMRPPPDLPPEPPHPPAVPLPAPAALLLAGLGLIGGLRWIR